MLNNATNKVSKNIKLPKNKEDGVALSFRFAILFVLL